MKIKYEFYFDDERTECFDMQFSDKTLNMEPFPLENEEPWTFLECKQCSVCTLKPSDNKYCPVARNLSYVLLQFKNDASFKKATIRVISDSRTTEKHTTLEEGVSPLMGLIMATSGCPILDKFKPMAFTHLPFSNEVETIFRAVGVYLTAQYICMKKNIPPDWELKHFTDMYSKVNQINADFSERVRELKGKDANINALVLLDLFAQVGTFYFSEDWMKQLEPYFSAYLN